jgi:hypothetical protein
MDEAPLAQDDSKPKEEKVSGGGGGDFEGKPEYVKASGGLQNFLGFLFLRFKEVQVSTRLINNLYML